MPNELSIGARRVGDFIDFYPETPQVKATLERSDRGISLTVPWSDPESEYAQWFMKDAGIMRLPAGPEPLPVPKRVLFRDSHGSVLLIRCWPRGYHSNVLGPGSGTLWARAAIMGPHEDLEFERPHGLKTEISGLRAWLGMTSWHEQRDWSSSSRAATLASQNPPAIEIGEHKGVALQFQPGWQIMREQDGDRRIALDLVRCVTRSDKPLAWDEHRQIHRAIRDLLVLSRWHVESCVEVSALRKDDPPRTLDGTEHPSEQWRAVVVPNDERASPPSRRQPHLLRYGELNEAGILRWLALRDEFARALDPVISSVDLRGTTANTMLAHVGPGLEALGYLLMMRDGVAERTASRANLRTRFDRILADVGECLPFDGPRWASTTVAAYNGLKHANRAEPDPVDVLNAWRECVMVGRAWVAVQLGVSTDHVRARLADDPQGAPFVAIE